MSKLSFRARALDASKPMPIYLAEELPDLPDYSAINRAVPQMPSGMEKEEESEHHLQKAISGTGLIIPTPEVCGVDDLEFYERCYPSDYKMPKQHIHMQPLWEEQEAPEYDIDSEDERWLKQQRHPELTELKFEQMMDKLEKSSGQTVVTLNEAKLLLERSDDLVIAVYDYWLNKRLNTQHPLILSVKTEHRPGQSSNNPYLAFRRRTEKMQTRKNRKNDESSYEKMLKLRRDLARALTLLEMVARRENAKKELVKLTALIAERRYHAGDFANQLLPDPPPRPTYNTVPLSPATFRRETYTIPHYPPRPPPTPVDQPRQREKRPYKRRKHRHPAVGSGQGPRDTAACTSSEEDSGSRADAATPPDDGPFAFRRKPGCYYEMPTSTLYGDPVDPESTSKDAMFEHEIDERHRYTLTSLRHPYQRCIGFARRRMCRGGRVALDRIATPLDDLWPKLPFTFTNSSQYRAERDEQIDMETKAHRTPKVMTRDFHTSGKYPWRHAFRQHLSRHPELWLEAPKPELELPEIKIEPMDFKCDDMPLKMEDDLSMDIDCAKNVMDGISIDIDGFKHDTDSVKNEEDSVKSDININRTIDGVVRANLDRVLRKRSWSGCSDSSYDSDESLQPVEKEFGNFISEVNKKWLHFRPKTPPPSPPQNDDLLSQQFPLGLDTPFTIELRAAETPPSDALDSFVTSEFSLGQLIPEVAHDADHSGHSMDISDDMLPDHFTGLTEAQVESILSETDLKALAEDDKKIEMSADILDELVNNVDGKDSFLLQGQSSDGRADSGPRKRKQAEAFGSTVVSVRPVDREPIMLDTVPPAPVVPAVVAAPVVAPIIKATPPKAALPKAAPPKAAPPKAAPPNAAPVPAARNKPAPAEHKHTPVPVADIIVEEVNELPPVKLEKKQKEDTIEEIQLSHGVQLKTVQTRHSPLKKHIITSTTHRRPVDSTVVTSVTTDVAPPAHSQPQIVTVAVSDSLKVYHQVRLQNHLLSTQSGVLVQNGPFPPVAVAVPVQQNTNATVGVASVANVTGVSTVGSVGSVAAVATVSGVSVSASGMATGIGAVNRRVSTPLVQLGSTLAHKHVHIHPPHGHASPPVVVAQSHTIHHVAPNKLKVIHAHPITQTQRTQLLAQNRTIAGLPAVVSLATIGEAKAPNALLKAAPGSVAQLFEIKSGQLGKGPHLVNVVRQPAPGKTTVTRLDLNDKKRHVVATLDGALKGNLAAATRPHRVNLSLDGRQIIRTAIPAVRAPQLRQQIQLKNRLQVSAPQLVRSGTEASTSITIAAPTKSTSLPSSVVANLLHKNVQLPKGGPKIAISGAGGAALAANVQAIAFTTAAQLKARQARLITQPRPTPVPEMAEATTVGSSSSSTPSSMPSGTPMESVAEGEDVATNGTVRRRTADTLPMEVT